MTRDTHNRLTAIAGGYGFYGERAEELIQYAIHIAHHTDLTAIVAMEDLCEYETDEYWHMIVPLEEYVDNTIRLRRKYQKPLFQLGA